MENTVWMQPPDGGPPEEIIADTQGLNISQKLVLHWRVCDPPAAPHAKAATSHAKAATEDE